MHTQQEKPGEVKTRSPHTIELVLREHRLSDDRNLAETVDRLIARAAEDLAVRRAHRQRLTDERSAMLAAGTPGITTPDATPQKASA